MNASNPALAKLAAKGGKASKPAVAKKTAKPRVARSDIPWQKIADLYDAGKTTAEISDKLELTRLKTKDGKKNPYPYYLVVGYLTKLSHGVKVDDKTIKIKRGKK